MKRKEKKRNEKKRKEKENKTKETKEKIRKHWIWCRHIISYENIMCTRWLLSLDLFQVLSRHWTRRHPKLQLPPQHLHFINSNIQKNNRNKTINEQSKQKHVTTYELSKQINQLRNIHNHNIWNQTKSISYK